MSKCLSHADRVAIHKTLDQILDRVQGREDDHKGEITHGLFTFQIGQLGTAEYDSLHA